MMEGVECKMKKVLLIFLILLFSIECSFSTVHATIKSPPEPVIYLDFDGDLEDNSGNGYNGVSSSGTVTYGTGVAGKAVRFDGSSITLKGSSAITWGNSFSVSVWIKLDKDTTSKIILDAKSQASKDQSLFSIMSSYRDTGITSSFLFESAQNSKIFFKKNFYSAESIDKKQNKDKFMHLVVVYDGSQVIYYFDGATNAKINKDFSSGKLFGQAQNIVLGGYSSDDYFYGYMDELKIFKQALTYDDVKTLYSIGADQATHIMTMEINNPYMTVDGVRKEIDPGVGTAPIINSKQRTLVPVRAILETIGGTVEWYPETKKIVLKYKSNEIVLWVNNDRALVNGLAVEIDPGRNVYPEIINDRTMLPIRFVLDNLGLTWKWDQAKMLITISYQ